MKRPRHVYPMTADERDEITGEFAEFGYRETDDSGEADRRRYYKVERWDSSQQHALQFCTRTMTLAAPSHLGVRD
jgi:hypothetical protein